jgi:hypothetical protein
LIDSGKLKIDGNTEHSVPTSPNAFPAGHFGIACKILK